MNLLPRNAIEDFKKMLEEDTSKVYSDEEAERLAYQWMENCCFIFDINKIDTS